MEWTVGQSTVDGVEVNLNVAEGIASRQVQVLDFCQPASAYTIVKYTRSGLPRKSEG